MPKFEGTIEEIVFRNDSNGWTVASVRLDGSGRTTAVGILPFLSAGEHVILDGELCEHRDYGEQIKVNSYELARPETKSGVEKYLGSGLIKGVGPATAKMIVAHFGRETLDVLESEPHRLTEIPGIGPKKAAMISGSFAMQNEMRVTLIFLQNAGLSPNLSMKVYRAYGDQCESVLKSNPYRLADEIEGVGFKTADQIARGMGFAVNNPSRLMSGVRFVLSEAVGKLGHMYLPCEFLIQSAADILSVDLSVSENSVRKLIVEGQLIETKAGEDRAVYLPSIYKAECETADLLIHLRNSFRRKDKLSDGERGIAQYEKEENVQLSAKQKEAVLAAVSSGISVVTGGPGTGKTTSINCILHLLKGKGEVELCAPTGRAAKRMSEATGYPARTIHRLLEYSGEIEGFQKDESDPIRADTVIVDEMSMVDIFLMRSLLRALRPNTRLILVGDADQLPSVGAGNVLRDLIASKTLNVVCLDQIFRQGQESHIIVNAHRINRGEYPLIQNRDTDFFLEKRENAQAALDSVVALVQKRLPQFLQADSLRDIQVMAPMKKGPLGVYKLNEALQQAVNPPSKEKAELNRGDCIFRMGDKVMQVRNNYDLEWEKDDEKGDGVFNGDIGYIVNLSRTDRELTVEFDDGRRAVYDDSMLDELELSYCISVHKSQGSEFPAVVLPLLSGPQMLMTRNLLYTAVTRARKMVVVVGREACMRQMVDNNHIRRRYSALSERLRELVQ